MINKNGNWEDYLIDKNTDYYNGGLFDSVYACCSTTDDLSATKASNSDWLTTATVAGDTLKATGSGISFGTCDLDDLAEKWYVEHEIENLRADIFDIVNNGGFNLESHNSFKDLINRIYELEAIVNSHNCQLAELYHTFEELKRTLQLEEHYPGFTRLF